MQRKISLFVFDETVKKEGRERERDRDGERDEGEIQLKLYTIENRKFSPKIQISRI